MVQVFEKDSTHETAGNPDLNDSQIIKNAEVSILKNMDLGNLDDKYIDENSKESIIYLNNIVNYSLKNNFMFYFSYLNQN